MTKHLPRPVTEYVEPQNLITLRKTVKLCPACDILIAHQDELEREIAYLFQQRQPEIVGNPYLVLGTQIAVFLVGGILGWFAAVIINAALAGFFVGFNKTFDVTISGYGGYCNVRAQSDYAGNGGSWGTSGAPYPGNNAMDGPLVPTTSVHSC